MRLERINDMEQYIIENESVSLERLASHFNISVNTVRRDIRELIERGQIKKVYGGVSSIRDDKNTPLPIAVRTAKNSASKQMIGELASSFVQNGDTIFLDSGSTVVCMLPYPAKKENITIVTHSLSAMYEASKYPSLKMIALGGFYNQTTSYFVGISTLEALSEISTDTIFIAATGVSLERGLTNTTFFEAEIKRKVVQRSDRVILLADSSKFDHAATISFFDFSDLYAVVTEKRPPQKYMDSIAQNNIRLLCDRSL